MNEVVIHLSTMPHDVSVATSGNNKPDGITHYKQSEEELKSWIKIFEPTPAKDR